VIAGVISAAFERSEFERIHGIYPEIAYWCMELDDSILCCSVYDFSKGHHLTTDELEEDYMRVKWHYKQLGFKTINTVSIVCTYDCKAAREHTIAEGVCWFIDLNEMRLIIYEDQKVADGPLRDMLETILERVREEAEKIRLSRGRRLKTAPVATITLTLINVIVFIIMEFIGSTTDAYFMYKHGAMYMPAITEGGEYYRLFTAMFLHFGIDHLAGNMMALIFIGDIVEKALGKVKYVLLYILSGILAGACSLLMNVYTDSLAVSAGASGAVFGIIGALIYIVWANRDRLRNLNLSRFVFAVAYMLFTGFTSVGVDNAAHVGGLIAGFILGTSFYRRKSITKESSL